MGLDVGDARIGVALSDPLGMFAQPAASVLRKSHEEYRQIADLAVREGVVRVIVGLPYELDGAVGPQAQKVLKFQKKLAQEFSREESLRAVEFVLWDERLTSRQAERIIQDRKLRNAERRAAVDRVSAAIILESYLQSRTLPSSGVK